MSERKNKYPNSMQQYRERIGFTQDQLAHIVGCKNDRRIRRIESGEIIPSSMIVLRLSLALRVPVDYLYLQTINILRVEVRAIEERMPKGRQGVLHCLYDRHVRVIVTTSAVRTDQCRRVFGLADR